MSACTTTSGGARRSRGWGCNWENHRNRAAGSGCHDAACSPILLLWSVESSSSSCLICLLRSRFSGICLIRLISCSRKCCFRTLLTARSCLATSARLSHSARNSRHALRSSCFGTSTLYPRLKHSAPQLRQWGFFGAVLACRIAVRHSKQT